MDEARQQSARDIAQVYADYPEEMKKYTDPVVAATRQVWNDHAHA